MVMFPMGFEHGSIDHCLTLNMGHTVAFAVHSIYVNIRDIP